MAHISSTKEYIKATLSHDPAGVRIYILDKMLEGLEKHLPVAEGGKK